MMWAQRFWLRLQTLFRRDRSTQRLDDEIQFHLDQQIAENIAGGMSREEARYAAMRTFGNPTFLQEETRDTWGWTWLEQIAQDIRYASRQLGRSPGFTLAVVLSLALGIGANTAIFSYIDAWVIKPLPYPHADRLVALAKGTASPRRSHPCNYESVFGSPRRGARNSPIDCRGDSPRAGVVPRKSGARIRSRPGRGPWPAGRRAVVSRARRAR